MRKIFFAIAILPFLTLANVAHAEYEGWKLGISGGQIGATATGTETTNGGDTTTEHGAFVDDVASIFAEVDMGRASIGLDYVISKITTPTNTVDGDDTVNHASAEFNDVVTLYGTVDLVWGVYLKAGLMNMTIKTTEVMNTASTSSVVGDVDTMGYTAGLGIKHDTGNGLELRLEALVAEIDDVEATGSNGSSYTTKDILGARAHVSIAKTF